jgi:hypothetical protein
MLYHGRGKLDEAEAMWKRALAEYKKVLEPEHLNTLMVVRNLGYHDGGMLNGILCHDL